jgi:hypothetical protein
MKQDELDCALILIYASSNAHMWVNYTILSERLDRFCKTRVAKLELVSVLRSLANDIAKKEAPTHEP